MQTQFDCDMQALMRGMEASYVKSNALMQEYQAACIRRDWNEADKLQFETLETIQIYLDATAMVHKRLEIAESKGR